ncbi:ADAM protease ADM-B [Blastomyces dermatitidis ER-3]|uniref:ADAM protease ADM-B n=1 Tax=Ajellomyces dermatitidis (strain ER-3 / ATCC MYA-2586) TaxID=559297 RepID=A0ABM9YFY0_AJEDR|nr:ADAM protease ADM-B [Blastomyces dermatitidis ER-3]EEQ84914.2 ADAM protease ADM-B [Blastomyces dermatitidis ER-3]
MRFFGGLVPLLTSVLAILVSNVDARSEKRDHIAYISLVEQPVIHTPSHRVNALSHFDITFELHKRQQRLKLSLEPNHDILPDGAQVHFVDQAGNVERSEFIKRRDHKVFRGWSWIQVGDGNWERVGWARVTIKQDGPNPLFEGAFTVNHDHHNILLRSSYTQSKHVLDKNVDDTTAEYMIVFRDSDMGHLMEDDDVTKRSSVEVRSCQADDLPFNSNPEHPIFRGAAEQDTSPWSPMSLDYIFGLNRRQFDVPGEGGNAGGVNLVSSIGSTAGCPSTRKVALIGVAADCSYIQSFDSQNQEARENIITVVNSASQLYEDTFNISLGLKNLTVVPAECPATPPATSAWNAACGDGSNGHTLSQRLNLFSAWRGRQHDDLAFWTLMTNCRTSAEVGLAWLGQLCNSEVRGNPDPGNSSSQVVTGANVVARTTNEWQVFAHEVGHTFGAVHDCDASLCAQSQSLTSQCCPLSRNSCDANERFIMNPTSRRGITQFSSCTVGNICSSMGRNSVRSDCLVNNRGVVTISGSQCGNGIVEEGEDCDCGGEASCKDNPCCDAQTCKFKDGAVCDDSNEDCCNNCQFQSSDTVCRPSTGPCDPEEKCTGNSGNCPADESAPNGKDCGNGLACASGQCTSRDHQCRTLMGSLLDGNDTFACDDQTCILACSSPSLPRNTCSSLRQNFLDGTPCASGGRCKNGVCEGSTFRSWIDNNRTLVIGLAAGLGGLILLSIFSCIIGRCRRPRHRKAMAPMTQGAVFSPPPRGIPGFRQPKPVDPFMPYPPQRGPGPGGPGVPPIEPPFPPPAYGSTAAARGRMPSVRYA